MSKAKKSVSLRTKIRRIRQDAEEQLLSKVKEITELTAVLRVSKNIIDSQFTSMLDHKKRIAELDSKLGQMAQLNKDLNRKLEERGRRMQVVLDILGKIASGELNTNAIVAIMAQLCSSAQDEVLVATANVWSKYFSSIPHWMGNLPEAAQENQKAASLNQKPRSPNISRDFMVYHSPNTIHSVHYCGDPSSSKEEKQAEPDLIKDLSEEAKKHLIELIRTDHKIKAITTLRDWCGCEILLAKNAIENLKSSL